jgi:glutamine synthetase
MTMIHMASREIIPAVETYLGTLAQTAKAKRDAFGENVDCSVEQTLIDRISQLEGKAFRALENLKSLEAKASGTGEKLARYYKEKILPAMSALRTPVDLLEMLVPDSVWPLPSYGDLTYKQ